MKTLTDIRKWYTPIQPTVKQSAEHVHYQEWLPDARLQEVIYCYWQLTTTQPLTEPFTYQVVADGCVDIFFEPHQPQESFIVGFSNKYIAFPLDRVFHYIGIRFLPTMFPQLFKVAASALSHRLEPLALVVPEISAFIKDHCSPELSPSLIKSVLDTCFLKCLAKADFNYDNRLYGAIELILKTSGGIDIETDLDTGISPRQLRRLFNFYVGDTAKTFSRVVRFQHILNANPSTQSLRHNKLFFDAGYYDQAHFIKEFKNFYGETPGKAFVP